MRLEKASYKAIKYSCLSFHYAKSIPSVICAYSVFNSQNEWCGTICYSAGANPKIGSPYGLPQGQAIELVRVALNGKQESTGKALSLSIKLIKKDCPLIKMLVSFADTSENHTGIIYQATNWHYIGLNQKSGGYSYNVDGKWIHKRSLGSKHGTRNTELLDKIYTGCAKRKDSDKFKYIYPLDKSLIPLCKKLSKPYPKKHAAEVLPVAQQASSQQEGFDSTLPLKRLDND